MQTDTTTEARGAQPESTSRLPRFYRPELDVLRFFAFLGVFFVHGPAYSLPAYATAAQKETLRHFYIAREAGDFGLDIFFLLSSYLITELLLRERESTGKIHLEAFYTRRILRIWPLYFLVIALGFSASLLIPQAQALTKAQLLYLLFFVGWLGKSTFHNGVGVLWSISVEEWFYIIWPGITKIGGARSVLFAALAIIPIALMAAAMVEDTWFNPIVQFLFFSVGALLALALRRRSLKQLPLLARAAMAVFGLWAFWVVGAYIGGYTDNMRPALTSAMYLLDALGCIAIFLVFYDMPKRLLPRPLIYLGKISYGLYVFHPFALVAVGRVIHSPMLGQNAVVPRLLVMNAAALGLTVLIASCSYRWFEKPILALKERFGYIPSRAA